MRSLHSYLPKSCKLIYRNQYKLIYRKHAMLFTIYSCVVKIRNCPIIRPIKQTKKDFLGAGGTTSLNRKSRKINDLRDFLLYR
jgi:hypothetical protein